MPQQINLYSPILLSPRRHFSARAMVQALGVLTLGLAALAAWSAHSASRMKADLDATAAANQREKAQLTAALASRASAPKDTQTLEQQLAQARSALAERRALLDALDPGRGGAGTGHGELLRMLAETVPDTLWLTELKRAEGRIELAGVALHPEALNPWLAELAQHPLLAGAPLRAVKVEHSDDVGTGTEGWTFRIVSGRAPGEPS